MITLGMNINDIVKFMTSPVASFINDITEDDIFNDYNLPISTAIDFAKGKFLNRKGEILDTYKLRYGTLTMIQIKDLYELYKLDDKENQQNILEDCNEFENVLEGADEFSNFGRLLGLNQGIGTSKIDLQKQINNIKSFYSKRIEKALKDPNIDSSIKENLKDFSSIDIKRWLNDKEYQKVIADNYNIAKKCINIFDAFQHIPQFNSIGKLMSAVIEVDDNISIKSKAFNSVLERAKQNFNFISEDYEKRMLKAVDTAIINKFIIDQNIFIPVLKDTSYLQSDRSSKTFDKNASFYLDSQSAIASFKEIFENKVIPRLKQGFIAEVDEDGNVTEQEYVDLKSNPFIYALIRSRERDVPIYKANINMNLINSSLNVQKQYQIYSRGLSALSKYKFGNITLSDAFMLYNLIINRNQYGENRLTGLFDSFVTKNKTLHLLYKYFKYLGDLDYNGVVHLDINTEFKEPSDNIPVLDISYKDILISAAAMVKSEKGQSDPYIILLGDIPTIKERHGFTYSTLQELLPKSSKETTEEYIDRLNNENRYFVLGGQFSDILQNKLQTIQDMNDIDKIMSYLNNFVADGLLTINKVCE